MNIIISLALIIVYIMDKDIGILIAAALFSIAASISFIGRKIEEMKIYINAGSNLAERLNEK